MRFLWLMCGRDCSNYQKYFKSSGRKNGIKKWIDGLEHKFLMVSVE